MTLLRAKHLLAYRRVRSVHDRSGVFNIAASIAGAYTARLGEVSAGQIDQIRPLLVSKRQEFVRGSCMTPQATQAVPTLGVAHERRAKRCEAPAVFPSGDDPLRASWQPT